jgi:hypothetical protein
LQRISSISNREAMPDRVKEATGISVPQHRPDKQHLLPVQLRSLKNHRPIWSHRRNRAVLRKKSHSETG